MQSDQCTELNGRPLSTTKLTLNGVERKFFYRLDSKGDKSAYRQVYEQMDYDLLKFRAVDSLFRFAQALEQQGRRKLILDLGANIGASALWFFAKNAGARIVAVEPEPNNFQLLERNCDGLEIMTVQAAIGAHAGTAFLDDPGLSDWGFRVAAKGQVPVRVVTVPDLLLDSATGEFTPYICKIDIEGGEADLFSENYSWIDQFPLVIIEFHDWLYPGKALSRNFLRAISEHDFDFVYRNENVFCFNNRLLRA